QTPSKHPRYHSLYTHPTPTDTYTLSLHDALPISGRTATPPTSARPLRHRSPLAGPGGNEWRARPARVNAGPSFPPGPASGDRWRSGEHTSELQSRGHLVWRLLLEETKKTKRRVRT